VRLLKRDNAHLQEKLNSDTAADWSKRLYSVAGLRMSKVSHAPRASGAQIAELNGVAEGQVSLCSFDLDLPCFLLTSLLADPPRGSLE
jgi:hypothetical protein